MIYPVFMFEKWPLLLVCIRNVSGTRGVWKKMEIPVVFGEGGSHVLHFTSKTLVSCTVSQQVVCQNMPFHASEFHIK